MRWITFLEQQRLNHKLALNLSILLLIMLGLGGFSLYSQKVLTDNIVFLYDNGLLGLSNAKTAHIHYAVIGRAMRQAIMAPDASQQQLAINQLVEAREKLGKETAELRNRLARTINQKNMERFDQAYAIYDQDIEKAFFLLRQARVDEARQIIISPEFQQKGIASYNALTQVSEVKEERAKELVRDAIEFVRSSQTKFLYLLGGGLLFGLTAGLLIARSIRQPTERLREAVTDISGGKLDAVVPYTDFPNEIGELAKAISILQFESKQMVSQRWIKSRQAEIQAELPTASSFTELAQKFLGAVSPLLNVAHGLFYTFEEEPQRLRLLGGYAHTERKHLEQYLALGQGAVGQCALERTPIIITNPSRDALNCDSNPFDTPHRLIALFPILSGKRLMGVIELVRTDSETFRQEELILLESVIPMLAMTMEILERR